MLCQQTGGCRQPFSYGMQGLIVYELVRLDVIFDTENFNFQTIILATCFSFGHGKLEPFHDSNSIAARLERLTPG